MSDFTHVVLGTNDLMKARNFYDQVLAPLGMMRLIDRDTMSVWGSRRPCFTVGLPFDGRPATYPNGLTIGLAASSATAVSEFHSTAIVLGGICEGPPGSRDFLPNGIIAYVRDPDGNKLCAVCSRPSG
jgi:catechol 2,3-dioxygenase-like lactoylglutathione lyase family enzyme